MNAMEFPLVLTVSVKLSGSENRALILGQGIACSSTNSPEVAVRGAVLANASMPKVLAGG